MAEHPLRAEIELWASDPKYWVWQSETSDGRWVNRPLNKPPGPTDAYRLVPQPWAENPEKWEVWNCYKNSTRWFISLNPRWDSHNNMVYELRPRRRMARIESAEFPAPETEAPKVGTSYWAADPSSDKYAGRCTWRGDEFDHRYLERGLVYLNEEDAAARSKAMLEMTLC